MLVKPRTSAQIQSEIALTRATYPQPFDRYPQIIECYNEKERLWVNNNGKCYIDLVTDAPCESFLLYFNGHLAIVEERGQTIFSHLTPKLEREMSRETTPNLQAATVLTSDQLVELIGGK
jgi:hypothetical protein